MKPILIISLAFVLMGSLGILSAEAQESNNTVQDPAVQDAIKTLKNSKPFHDLELNATHLPDQNSPEGKAFMTLYESQVKAIELLGKTKIPGTSELLLPYLDYRDQQYPDSYAGYTMGDDRDVVCMSYPTLAALREIPESATTLISYILDKKNPIDMRLTAFHALSYVDPSQRKVVGNQLLAEFSNSAPRTTAVKVVMGGRRPFLGMIHVKDYGEPQ